MPVRIEAHPVVDNGLNGVVIVGSSIHRPAEDPSRTWGVLIWSKLISPFAD